jgi:hypothetical protein
MIILQSLSYANAVTQTDQPFAAKHFLLPFHRPIAYFFHFVPKTFDFVMAFPGSLPEVDSSGDLWNNTLNKPFVVTPRHQ